jgi:hypothetical protein
VEQLIAWQPGKLGKQLRQDGPMSLWFAELRARNIANPAETTATQHFMGGRFLTSGQRAKRVVIPHDRYLESMHD